ncbi:hypothetical protein SESBI_03420 [Sesbania bispinosa]|nr:hypothetical protein SESBI_03420 [Sesbania bispinosa]
MEYQSFGRPQRPKGANIKQALKVMLILAVCAWLVYQIKHSNYGGQTKLVAGYGAISLGRKGIPLQLDERTLPDSGNVDSVVEAKESSSGRDDVSDGAKEDKAEEEFGHINEKNFRTNGGKEVKLELESQLKVSSKDKYQDSSKEKSGKVDIESRRNELGHNEHGYEKYQKRPVINDSKSNEKEIEVQLREQPNVVQVIKNAKSDLSVKEIDEDEDPRIVENETRIQKNVVESVANASLAEEIDEVQSFHDENGVPPDGNETEIVVGLAHFLHLENISNVSKGSWLGEINIHEVTFGEEKDVEFNLERSKNDAMVDEEINRSRFKHNSEIVK